MSLSPNEIKARAARFAHEWRDPRYKRGETHTFYNEFFEIFGVSRRRVATYEEPVKLLGNNGVLLLTTVQLYDLWKSVHEDRRAAEDIIAELHEKSGLFKV